MSLCNAQQWLIIIIVVGIFEVTVSAHKFQFLGWFQWF